MNKLNLKASNDYEKAILDYLESNASDALAAKINSGQKTLQSCFDYIRLVRLKDGDTQMPYIYYFGEVYPASIGQFTGVYDKNGDEIYEGDILEFDGAGIPEEERAEVVYIASEGCFKLKNPRYDYMDDLNSLTASMEIIVGNTYDGIYGEDKRGTEE